MGLLGFVSGAAGAAQDNLVSQRKDAAQEARDRRLHQYGVERDAVNHERTMERDQFSVDNRPPQYDHDAQGNAVAITGNTARPVTMEDGSPLVKAGKADADWAVTSLGDGRFVQHNKRTGETRPHEGLGAGSPGSGSSGAKTADYNALKGGIKDKFGTMDPNGNFIMPAGADVEYGKSLEIGNDLINMGVPIGRATHMAYAAVRGPMDEKKAAEAAEREAAEKFPGMLSRSKRKEYVESRIPELIQESRWALEEYNRMMGQGGAASMGQASPRPPSAQRQSTQLKPQYTHSSGRQVSREEIEQTARNRGITPEQVIQQLGLK